MNTKQRPGTWEQTYRKVHVGNAFDYATASITTAITDRLDLVSDLEIRLRVKGKATATAEISLDAASMRELAALLEAAADRVDELVQMRERMMDEEAAA